MSDEPETGGRSLGGERTDQVQSACERHGFPLQSASLHRDVLTLIPESLEGLPNAAVLEALAGDLEEAGFHYVTFSVPESDDSSP